MRPTLKLKAHQKVLTWTISETEEILSDTHVEIYNCECNRSPQEHTDAALELLDGSDNSLAQAQNISFSETFEGLHVATCTRDNSGGRPNECHVND